MIDVEICLFNSLTKYAAQQPAFRLRVPPGTSAEELVRGLPIPPSEIYVAWRNGRNIMSTFGGEIEDGVELCDGDRLALSGPVPFSLGYGAPVC